MKRWTVLGLVAVAVVAAVMGAAALTAAWAHGAGGHGMHGRMMKRMVSAALDEALDQAGVTDTQRTAIHASRDRAFAALEAQKPDRSTHREKVLTLFEADRIEPAQLQALHAEMDQRHQAIRSAITQSIVEIHDTLTPGQRRVVAQFVRSHGPGAWR
jgi:Spy/CpxP family protein refolding chaperone